MHRFNAVVDRARVRFANLADMLYGCAHHRTTFPMTLRTNGHLSGGRSPQPETYIACLDCGRHFAYDWTTMRITKRPRAWVAPPVLLQARREARRGLR